MVTMLYLSQRDAKTLLHRYTSTWKKHPRLSCTTLNADFWNTSRTERLGSSKKPRFTMIIFMVLPINVRNRSVVTSCLVFRKSIHRFANSSTQQFNPYTHSELVSVGISYILFVFYCNVEDCICTQKKKWVILFFVYLDKNLSRVHLFPLYKYFVQRDAEDRIFIWLDAL